MIFPLLSRRSAAAAISALFFAVPQAQVMPGPIARAQAAVEKNLQAEPGSKYSDSAAAAARAQLSAARDSCRETIAPAPVATANAQGAPGPSLFLMLNRRGIAKDGFLHPHTPADTCFLRKVRMTLQLPPPPDGNYWIRLDPPMARKAVEAPAPTRKMK